MTRRVLTVLEDAPFKAVVDLLSRERISAVPVVDADGRPVGLISEADILFKAERRSDDAYMLESRQHRLERAKAHGATAAEVMTRPVATVRPEVPVSEAARMLHSRDVKRFVVVDGEDRLVGIATRGDLLKVFLRSDAEIQAEALALLHAAAPRLQIKGLGVTVEGGAVTLTGQVPFRSQALRAERLAGEPDGVVTVINRLEFDIDDSRLLGVGTG